MVAYLKLMEVYGRENGGGVFLWLLSNIKVLVTASYIMGKCRTGVFVSVFCGARDSMQLLYDKDIRNDNGCPLSYMDRPRVGTRGSGPIAPDSLQ